ncbi:hypothetical protein CDD82_1618 [Ophiocordyceps australis]|uniref:Ribosomal RNA-processing protein 42 n=1 Tax=Ophiocordyceps australis TaxID=1399860 RepID=A0A2C5Y684_9HYPO|nr:hypothetical protein CDD82_1618 [Ophiocordyceps australis]
MAAQQNGFSPAELAYLHDSLSLQPPIRPDGRGATQFRPLTAETGILPGTNGSARVCFSDGSEAIVGVKAEIEKTGAEWAGGQQVDVKTRDEWLEMTVEIPGQREDEATTVYLAEMLREALLADGEFATKLRVNKGHHWRLYLDILLISPPLSYPLPLLSLTTHLALLATRIPRLKSEADEDPMFDDDWEASEFLYPRQGVTSGSRPPITLLVAVVGNNILFDPARQELAVAETALAVSVAEVRKPSAQQQDTQGRNVQLLSTRSIDPPSRLTPPGVSNAANVATSGASSATAQSTQRIVANGQELGVWRAPVGGTKLAVLNQIIQTVLVKGGIAQDVLDALEAIEVA